MGHVKKASKSTSLNSTTSYVASLATNPSGNLAISGHMDHTIYKYDI